MDSTSASTSGASGSPPVEMQKLFSWNPPILLAKSSVRRQRYQLKLDRLRFYDKHFKKSFVLQGVEHFSALPTYLAENVDKTLQAATKLPKTSSRRSLNRLTCQVLQHIRPIPKIKAKKRRRQQ